MTKKVANLVLLLVVVIAFWSGLSLWSQPPYDPDLGWHLFGGLYTASHQAVPTFDLINSFSTRWHDYHWLAQLGLYAIYSRFSYQGLSVALGIISALIMLILSTICYRKKIVIRSPIISVIAMIFFLALVVKVTSVRPQIISLFFLALTLCQLSCYRWKYEIIPLVFYAVFSANSHIYWVFIPFLYFVYRLVPKGSWPCTRAQYYCRVVSFIFLSSAALVSPYGIFHDSSGWVFENYALIYDYLVMPEPLRQSIGELQSSFAAGASTPILLCFAMVIFALGFRRSDLQTNRSDLIVALVSLVLAVRAMKFLAVFALFSFPYFLLCLFRVSRPLRSKKLIAGGALSSQILIVSALLACTVSIIQFPRTAIISDQLNEFLPLKACSAIAQLPLTPQQGRDHVRVLTHFNYGGWCRWIIFQEQPTKDMRVTIDGRTQWFPPEFFAKALDLYNARHEWLATLKEWNPDVILVPREKPLASMLALARGDWKLEYEDSLFAVFTPITK